jgi:hypothetical protein
MPFLRGSLGQIAGVNAMGAEDISARPAIVLHDWQICQSSQKSTHLSPTGGRCSRLRKADYIAHSRAHDQIAFAQERVLLDQLVFVQES